ncbi:MAG: hypothetical protein ABIP55_00165, partial [Tepidisphaeraceae bacterium]
PVAKVMGVKFDEGGSRDSRARRFARMRDLPQFRCPNNDIQALQFGSTLTNVNTDSPPTIVTHGRMISYISSMTFVLGRDKLVPGTAGVTTTRNPSFQVPSSYNGKLAKVGDAARKIFIADGSRYSNQAVFPDYSLNHLGSYGGSFSDQGQSKFSNSWSRGGVPGSGVAGAVDARVYWARHGPTFRRNAPSGYYQFNCGFFDGHVETMTDLAGANPQLWYPKGTELDTTVGQIYTDVTNAHKLPALAKFVVPF